MVIVSIFSCAYWPFVYLLWKNVYPWPLLIFELGFLLLLLSFRSSLYFVDINLLSDIWFSNLSSHFFGLPLFSVDTTFWWQIFTFSSSPVSVFSFAAVSLVSCPGSDCQIPGCEVLSYFFFKELHSYRSYI